MISTAATLDTGRTLACVDCSSASDELEISIILELLGFFDLEEDAIIASASVGC